MSTAAGPGEGLPDTDYTTGRLQSFVAKVRARESVVGYWVVLDSAVSTERVARIGYDFVALDAQHGLFGYEGMLRNLQAIDAAATAAPVVRVGANDQFQIGRALDAGAVLVIVPLVESAAEAAAAVSYTQHPPFGTRSYGPMRSGLRIGPNPAQVRDQVGCLVMIETADGLDNVEEICATEGLTGVYVGPSDLTLALGGASSTDGAVASEFEAALVRVRTAAAAAGIAAGIHTPSGEVANRRLREGFTFASVASDVTHLERVAADHLASARS